MSPLRSQIILWLLNILAKHIMKGEEMCLILWWLTAPLLGIIWRLLKETRWSHTHYSAVHVWPEAQGSSLHKTPSRHCTWTHTWPCKCQSLIRDLQARSLSVWLISWECEQHDCWRVLLWFIYSLCISISHNAANEALQRATHVTSEDGLQLQIQSDVNFTLYWARICGRGSNRRLYTVRKRLKERKKRNKERIMLSYRCSV